jgi:Probable lipid transfer
MQAINPSQQCCENLDVVYKNGTDCICKVVGSPELSTELGLDAMEISNMLVECKITETSTSLCFDSGKYFTRKIFYIVY